MTAFLSRPFKSPTTLMFEAIAENDLDELRRALEAGAQVNAFYTGAGLPEFPLPKLFGRMRVGDKSLEMAALLIDHGAELSSADPDGSPLVVCLRKLQDEMPSHGASPLNEEAQQVMAAIHLLLDRGLNLHSPVMGPSGKPGSSGSALDGFAEADRRGVRPLLDQILAERQAARLEEATPRQPGARRSPRL